MRRTIQNEEVRGIEIDPQTRCGHWHGELDIIAIKFHCCGEWFPCFECHSAEADHTASVWPGNQRDVKAVLCGACGNQLSITEYLNCNFTCPKCERGFNPGCSKHYHLYFA